MLRLLLAAALVISLAAPASAQWPTTEWTILDEATNYEPPEGDRSPFATQHAGILHGASRWFESLGFSAPLQRTPDDDLTVAPGETYVAFLNANATENGSSHNTDGYMKLTTHPGFLALGSPAWELMGASAVHELFHAVQKSTAPALNARIATRLASLPECPGDSDVDWLVEGTAAAVQIRWVEGQIGGRYGHPFKGSSRAAWVRPFDQPLQRGSLPPERRAGSGEPVMSTIENVSWACDYGAWYFWYAVGDMIGRTDAEKVTYLRYLFDRTGSWDDGGVANVDAGLRAAAEAYDAIRPYRNGLYSLYPEFVAQYLMEDRFYAALQEVDLGAPGLFETTSSTSGGPLGPLASRAWRVRVRLPANTSSIPYTIRITLDAEGGTDRDALHLIVDEDVVGRPVDPTAPYTAVQRTDLAEPSADGTLEVFVRVANVAEVAATTENAEFTLRVEVDGFYGEVPTGGLTAGEIGGELPPGFTVNGPGLWTCQGGARTRAVFDLMTPDEIGRDAERLIPEMAQDLSDRMDDLEIMFQQIEQQGAAAGMAPAQIAEIRREAEARMAEAMTETQPRMSEAADEARARNVTRLLATFVGETGGAECQLTLDATLPGREGGAQILPGAADPGRYPEDEAPGFSTKVYPESYLNMLRTGLGAGSVGSPGTPPPGLADMDDPLNRWTMCMMTEEGRRQARNVAAESRCPPVLCTDGQLVLERAEQNRIAGSFQFEVLRWPEVYSGQCPVPDRNVVTGHFNVASTDDGLDDNSLMNGVGSIFGGAALIRPGSPIITLPTID